MAREHRRPPSAFEMDVPFERYAFGSCVGVVVEPTAWMFRLVMETLPQEKRQAIEQTMRDFEQLFSLQGDLVLEIGSRGNATAEALLSMGAQSVICTNLVRNAEIHQCDRIYYVRADARAAPFTCEAFDVLFGRAILEHIHQLSLLRNEIIRIVRPGGLFYLDGGPLWCSPAGHHLWLRAPSGRDYRFSDHDCPIHDWEHLLLSEDEMVGVLNQRRVDEADVQAIVDYVYHAQGQNRLSTTAICDAFKGGPDLDVVIIKDGSPIPPPPRLVDEYGMAELTTTRLVIAGRKKTSPDEPDTLSGTLTGTREPTPHLEQGRSPRTGLGRYYADLRNRVAAYIIRSHPRLARTYVDIRHRKPGS